MKHAAVLDIGSSKVVCLCGGRVGHDGVAVHGADVCAHAGYRHGRWQDPAELERAIAQVVEATQRECGFRIRELVISVPAPFMRLICGRGALDLGNGKPKRITNADIDMLINESMGEMPEGYQLMHSTPMWFRADGAKYIDVPLDLMAARLEANVSHVYAHMEFLAPVQDALDALDIEMGACIAAPLAEALLVIPQDKRREPAVLIDVGYTHTDIAVVQYDALLALDTIEMGGLHLASDLQYGLEIPLQAAEQVKRRYTFALDYQDSVELVRTAQGTRQVDRATIQFILEERAKELAAMIYESLLEMPVDLKRKPAVHLAGGGIAMMPGSAGFFERLLGMRISRETPWMPRMSSPNYVSAFGTLEFLLHAGADAVLGGGHGEGGMMRRLKEFFVK